MARAPELVSDAFRRTVAAGEGLPESDYQAALVDRQQLIEAVAAWAAGYDAILCPPTLGEAPDLATTGDPRCCFRWSLIGAPALTLPSGTGPSGLPLGLQMCAAPGSDRPLVDAAVWVEAALRVE